MARVAWENRDNLGYAWKVLSRGVCDGCALGVAGLHDWTIDGVHLCMTRLNLLRLNTMPALDAAPPGRRRGAARAAQRRAARARPAALPDAARARRPRLPPHHLGRGLRPHRRAHPRAADRERIAFYLTARGVTNEIYYVAQKVARFLGTNNIDNAARLCHSPSTGAMKRALGVAASTCSYRDWCGTDLIVFFGSNPANDQPVTMKYLHEAKKPRHQGRAGQPATASRAWSATGCRRRRAARSSAPTSPTTGSGVAQGGDIAFLYGVLKVLIENGWIDRDFIAAAHRRASTSSPPHVDALDWPALERAGRPAARQHGGVRRR